jgi:hypothetical protein
MASGSVHGDSETDKLQGLGEVLEEDRVYYRWQSTESGENLARAGRMDATLNQYFMGLKERVSAGSGIYMAGGPASSADYLPSTGGNLLELRVAKGTRVIDLKDMDTLLKLKALGLSSSELERGYGSSDGILLRYSKDWYVGKNLTDKVSFEMYPGASPSHEQIVDHLRKIYLPEARRQALDQFMSRRPNARAEIMKNPSTLDIALQAATPAEAKTLVRRTLAENPTVAETKEMWTHIAARPDVARAVASDEGLRPRLLSDMRAHINEHGSRGAILDPGREPFYEAMLKDPSLSPEERAFVRKTLVLTSLRSPDLYKNPEEVLRRLLPIVEKVEFGGADRERLLAQLKGLVGHLERGLQSGASALKLIRAGVGGDPGLEERLDALMSRRRLVVQANAKPSESRALAALRSARTITDLEVVHQALDAGMASPIVQNAMTTFARQHENDLVRLIQPDMDRSMGVADNIKNDALYDALYRQNLSQDVSAREEYLGSCMKTSACRKNLVRQVAADGRIFDGFRSYSYLQSSLEKVTGEPDFKRELFGLMVKTARSQSQLDEVARAFPTESRSAEARELVRARTEFFAKNSTVVSLHSLCR